MTSISWKSIQHDWAVESSDGQQVGKVFLVCGDDGEDIFDGLAITQHGQDVLERIRSESTLVLAASLQLLTPAQRSALAEALPVLEQLAEAPGSTVIAQVFR